MRTEPCPNFFIVGAQKSGTSALAGWLQQHPNVFMSLPKEPGYLAFLEQGYPFPDGYGGRAPASDWVINDERTYLELFSTASTQETVLGDASTWYFSVNGTAQRIKQFSPEARILVILRNPADRAYSAWCHARRDKLEPCERFSEALDMEQERGEVEFLLRYYQMGLYSEALSEYLRVFDPSRLLVLFYEDLLGDEQTLWAKLCKFLAIDSLDRPPPQRRLNRSGQPRSELMQRMLKSYPLRKAVQRLIPYSGATMIKEKLDRVNLRRFPPLDPVNRKHLQELYRQDIEQLENLTGRDLRAWLA